MNALVDRFPESVEIDGVEYEINADFRVGVEIMLAFEDPDLTDSDKQYVMLNLLYKEIPPDIAKACELAVLFLDCGEERTDGECGDATRLYSFSHDAKYIYSAIRQSHGIDLETVKYLHWWKFCYLFMDLREDCFFQQMLHLRRQKSEGKLTKEERAVYVRMHDILDLPAQMTAEESEDVDEFMTLLMG